MVGVIAKKGLARHATLQDVVRVSGDHESWLPGHGVDSGVSSLALEIGKNRTNPDVLLTLLTVIVRQHRRFVAVWFASTVYLPFELGLYHREAGDCAKPSAYASQKETA
jgi:hypothetical protein